MTSYVRNFLLSINKKKKPINRTVLIKNEARRTMKKLKETERKQTHY